MFIDIKELKNRYNLNISSVLHVGAHKAEELLRYKEIGVQKTYWVEANPNLAQALELTVADENNIVLNHAVSDADFQEVTFNVANNGESSSILPLGLHKNLFPSIVYVDSFTVKTYTIDSIFRDHGIESIDFLNLDIQGAELLALKGASSSLDKIGSIYMEINEAHVYENCGLLSEVVDFLNGFGFYLAEKKMYMNQPWGDGFFLKKAVDKP